MATYSSILAWRTPWIEEPSRHQSMGLQRAGLDRDGIACLASVFTLFQQCTSEFFLSCDICQLTQRCAQNRLQSSFNKVYRNIVSLISFPYFESFPMN